MILMNKVKILELNDSTSQEFVFLCFRFDYIFIEDDGTPKAAIGTKKTAGAHSSCDNSRTPSRQIIII